MSEIRVEIATEKDWEACKNLRIQAVEGEDGKMFNSSSSMVTFEKTKTKEMWQYELFSHDLFYVLAWEGLEAVGIGRAVQASKDMWGMFSAYVKPAFRRQHIAQTMFAARLNEIQKRGGCEVYSMIYAINTNQLNLVKKFGFTDLIQGCNISPVYYQMGKYIDEQTDWLTFLEEEKK